MRESCGPGRCGLDSPVHLSARLIVFHSLEKGPLLGRSRESQPARGFLPYWHKVSGETGPGSGKRITSGASRTSKQAAAMRPPPHPLCRSGAAAARIAPTQCSRGFRPRSAASGCASRYSSQSNRGCGLAQLFRWRSENAATGTHPGSPLPDTVTRNKPDRRAGAAGGPQRRRTPGRTPGSGVTHRTCGGHIRVFPRVKCGIKKPPQFSPVRRGPHHILELFRESRIVPLLPNGILG